MEHRHNHAYKLGALQESALPYLLYSLPYSTIAASLIQDECHLTVISCVFHNTVTSLSRLMGLPLPPKRLLNLVRIYALTFSLEVHPQVGMRNLALPYSVAAKARAA